MWLELYSWIESFKGVSFDPYETLDVADSEMAFLDPFGWKSYLGISIDNLMEILNTIEEHLQEAPDYLDDISRTKTNFAKQAVEEIIDKVNTVKTMMGLEITKIKGLDGLRSNIDLLTNLIEYCGEHNVDEAVNPNTFNSFNETNDNDITNTLGIHNQDMMNIWQAISDVKDIHSDDELEGLSI